MFFQYALHLYNLDTARFVHYHHQLVPVIRGYAMELMRPPTPPPAGVAPEQINAPPPSSLTPTPQGLSPSPQSVSNGPPPEALSVPEPSSIVILAFGVAFVAARVYKKRRPAGSC
jgi:hypothetical protein